MKNLYQTIAFTGANLLALGANLNPLVQPVSALVEDGGTNKVQALTEGQLLALEAAHLKVNNACKWGHASFDPIRVESEEISEEVLSLHRQMSVA